MGSHIEVGDVLRITTYYPEGNNNKWTVATPEHPMWAVATSRIGDVIIICGDILTTQNPHSPAVDCLEPGDQGYVDRRDTWTTPDPADWPEEVCVAMMKRNLMIEGN